MGKIVISLLEFTPKTGDVVYLVLIAPNKIGEHEAMLWLSPTMEEATRRFHHANHHCDDWQLNNPAGEATRFNALFCDMICDFGVQGEQPTFVKMANVILSLFSGDPEENRQ